MAEFVYVASGTNGGWNGAAVLQVQAFPEGKSPEMMARLLDFCEQADLSCEIMSEKDPAAADMVRIYLLLRKSLRNPEQLRRELEQTAELVKDRLIFAGFTTVPLPAEEAARYGKELGERKNLLLCVPGENLRKVEHCYAPGGYTEVFRLDLPYLFSLIAKNPGSGISLQTKPVRYTGLEKEMLQKNLTWVERYCPMKDRAKAEEAFKWYNSLIGRGLLFAAITVWGPDEALAAMIPVVRQAKFEIKTIPAGRYYQKDYLMNGEQMLQNYAISFGHVLHRGQVIPDGLERMNYLTVPGCLAELLRSGFEKEPLAGVEVKKVVKEAVLPEQLTDEKGIYLGTMRERADQVKVYLPIDNMAKHMVIAGMPGSGKTMCMFQLLVQCADKNIPFLAIEPTKTEYRELLQAIPDLKILTPGRTDLNPVMFNPFLPPHGVTLEQFLPSLLTAFRTAFDLVSPYDIILKEVLQSCYVRYGWRNTSTRDSDEAEIFGMQEFIQVYKDHVEHSTYDRESKGNLLSGGAYRFESLLNSNRYLFDTDRTMSMEELLSGRTIIELDAIDNPEEKSLFLSLLLLQLKLVIRKNQRSDSRLKNVILIDEAHVLLGGSGRRYDRDGADPVGHTIDALLDMVKVNRAYGTGMVFADQSLGLLRTFAENSETKIIYKLEASDDRRILVDNLNISEGVYEQISRLNKGECYLFGGMVKDPVPVQGNNVRAERNIPKEMEDEVVRSRMKPEPVRPFAGCTCRKGCDLEIRTEAEFIARSVCDLARDLLRDREALENYIRMDLGTVIESRTEDFDESKRLAKCARFLTERMLRTKASEAQDGGM